MRLTKELKPPYERVAGEEYVYTSETRLTPSFAKVEQKLGQLEDLMEKYEIESPEDLEKVIINYIDNSLCLIFMHDYLKKIDRLDDCKKYIERSLLNKETEKVKSDELKNDSDWEFAGNKK